MPSALSGLSEGLWGSIDEQRLENQRLENERSQNERSILGTLLSSKDPKVQSYAVAGLLDAAGPKRRLKGMRGLLGEFDTNPAIQDIHRYLTTPQTTVTPGLPSTNLIPTGPTTPGPVVPPASQGPQLPAPPKQGAAAMPATSPVTGGPMVGAPPPAPVGGPKGTNWWDDRGINEPMRGGTGRDPFGNWQSQITPQPGVIRQEHAGPPVGRTDTTYPQAFYTPEEAVGAQARAQRLGALNADRAELEAIGASPQEIEDTLRARIAGRHGEGASFQGVTNGSMLPPGTLDAFGRPVQPGQNYRAVNGQYHPVIASATQAPLKVLQMPNGKPGLYRVNPDNSREFVGNVPEGTKYVRVANADGSEQLIEVPSFAAPENAPAGPTPAAQGTTAPAPGGPPPAPGAAPLGVAAASGPPPAPASAGPKVIAQTKPASFTPVTVKKADGTIGGALKTKDGQFVDSATKAPLAGAVEVPSSANLDKPLSAQAKKDLETVGTTQALIARIETALGNRGLEHGNLGLGDYAKMIGQVVHGYGQQGLYTAGLPPSDPAYRELIPLIQNLQVLATSPYLKGIRNMDYVNQIQAHMPKVYDAPFQIRQKLDQQKETFKKMVSEIHEVEGTGLSPKTTDGSGKIPTTMATVRAWAKAKGMSEQDAIHDVEQNRNAVITDKP